MRLVRCLGVVLPPVAPLPRKVDWSALSLRSREAVLHITEREAAGFSLDEIAPTLDRERPELHHLQLPPKVTKAWLAARMRDVRREIEATTGAASG